LNVEKLITEFVVAMTTGDVVVLVEAVVVRALQQGKLSDSAYLTYRPSVIYR